MSRSRIQVVPDDVPDVAEAPEALEATEGHGTQDRRDGIVVRTVSKSIQLIGETSVVVGGTALGSLAKVGLPDPVAEAMVSGQATTMHSVSGLTDTVTSATLRGVGKGGRVLVGGSVGALTGAAKGAASGAKKAWRH